MKLYYSQAGSNAHSRGLRFLRIWNGCDVEPRNLTDGELLSFRGVGKKTLRVIRGLMNRPGNVVCPHCGSELYDKRKHP